MELRGKSEEAPEYKIVPGHCWGRTPVGKQDDLLTVSVHLSFPSEIELDQKVIRGVCHVVEGVNPASRSQVGTLRQVVVQLRQLLSLALISQPAWHNFSQFQICCQVFCQSLAASLAQRSTIGLSTAM